MLLLVEDEAPLVHLPIEVNGQLRNARDRLVDVDQVDLAVDAHEAAAHPEIAVEPRVQQYAAVDLDRELTPAEASGVRVRLDSQPGRVGVSAHEPERCVGTASLRHRPCDERPTPHDVTTVDPLPARRLADRCEPRSFESEAG